MTRYYTLVARELLPELLDHPPTMPDGLRLIRVIEAPTPPGFELTELEDDGAPAAMDGRRVTPTISAEYEGGKIVRTWISDRHVEAP